VGLSFGRDGFQGRAGAGELGFNRLFAVSGSEVWMASGAGRSPGFEEEEWWRIHANGLTEHCARLSAVGSRSTTPPVLFRSRTALVGARVTSENSLGWLELLLDL
jgi:hypothetical protein